MENNYCDVVNNINSLDAVISDNSGDIYIDWIEGETVDITSVIIQNNFLLLRYFYC